MTGKFPLFASISNLINEDVKALSDENKKTVSTRFKSFDKSAHELVYALIKSFDVNSKSSTTTALPYGGKKLKSGIKFDISDMPPRLQHILFRFSEMHSKIPKK